MAEPLGQVSCSRGEFSSTNPFARLAPRFSHPAASSRRLSIFLINGLAVNGVNKMHAAARGADHRFIALLLRSSRMIGDPALDPQAGLGAAVQECSHSFIMKKQPRPEPCRCLGAATVRPGLLAHCLLLLGRLENYGLCRLMRVDPDQRGDDSDRGGDWIKGKRWGRMRAQAAGFISVAFEVTAVGSPSHSATSGQISRRTRLLMNRPR
jgi:hypothetical protein